MSRPRPARRNGGQGNGLTPTLAAISRGIAVATARPDSPRRRWFLGGATVHGHLVAAAFEAGVTVLAGTDSEPHGRVADEVRALASAGASPHDALGAASWAAREYLGYPGLVAGAPADVVVYSQDPRKDLRQLDAPVAIICRGHLCEAGNA